MDLSIVRKILLDSLKFEAIDYEHARVLTIAHDNDRSLFHNGKYYSPLVDTIEDDLRKLDVHCVSVARIISRVKGEISYGNARSPEGRFARALIAKRIAGLFQKSEYCYSLMEEKVWGEILDRVGARCVVAILPSRELCNACRKRGIWVADVQHGVIAEKHPWYGANFRASDPVDYLPHTFLVWDPGSQQVIQKWSAAKGIFPMVTGNRWVARFLRRDPEDALVADLYRQFPDPLTDGRRTILVSLSWGDYNISNGFITEGLEDYIRRTANDFRWYIRLHPNQLKGFATDESVRFFKYFKERLQGFATWEIATRAPLPVVLAHSSLHISWMSSVCIEAAQMGIRSALLNPRLRSIDEIGDYYEYYRSNGMVELVKESSAEIERWVIENIDRKDAPEDYAKYDQTYASLIDFLVHSPLQPQRSN